MPPAHRKRFPRAAASRIRVVLGACALVALAPWTAAFSAGTAAAAPARHVLRPDSLHAVGPPSWWDGTCDAGHWDAVASSEGWSGAGAHPLGASFLGVPVCGPRPAEDGSPDITWSRPGWGEYEWECVELAMRFMNQIYGVQPYGANGDSVVSNYSTGDGGGLVKIANGHVGIAPEPGDVISFSDPYNPEGHVAVVASTSVDRNGDGSILLLSQNDTVDGWRTLSVSHWTVQGFGSFWPTAWLHSPDGVPPPPSVPPPPPRHPAPTPERTPPRPTPRAVPSTPAPPPPARPAVVAVVRRVAPRPAPAVAPPPPPPPGVLYAYGMGRFCGVLGSFVWPVVRTRHAGTRRPLPVRGTRRVTFLRSGTTLS